MSDKNTRFEYFGLDYCEMATDQRPFWCHFGVKSKATGKVILEFYTNKHLEGWFIFDETTYTYRQTRGTMQFEMPASKTAARAKLKRMADNLNR